VSAYVIGLDLGQTNDFSALCVVERPARGAPGAKAVPRAYALRHLVRYPLGTAYTEIVPQVVQVATTPPLRGSPLVVDQTGVGRALVDMLKRSYAGGRVIPVTVTAGHATTASDDGFHVPKKELVTRLQLLLQGGRLKIARDLPFADILLTELQNFRVKITAAANEVFGAFGSGQHDDLVFSVMLACWWAERGGGAIRRGDFIVPEVDERAWTPRS
jgi:hypothetical protein